MIVKLHTTTSTNTYLKDWLTSNIPKNYMVVIADEQTQARGQMGTKWLSEKGKNLTFSIFVKFQSIDVGRQFVINQIVSIALAKALKKYIPNLSIKWPNDILADTKKIAGILIENTVSKNKIKHSIIGIGLNVNQTDFPEEITAATSMQLVCNRAFELDALLLEIIDSLKQQFLLLEKGEKQMLETTYLENLYLFQKTTKFKSKNRESLTGKIVGITQTGRLQVQLDNAEILDFGHKEIIFS